MYALCGLLNPPDKPRCLQLQGRVFVKGGEGGWGGVEEEGVCVEKDPSAARFQKEPTSRRLSAFGDAQGSAEVAPGCEPLPQSSKWIFFLPLNESDCFLIERKPLYRAPPDPKQSLSCGAGSTGMEFT